MREGSRSVIIVAFFANLGIAMAKSVGFLLTGAASILAEAVHSLADTGNQGLLILGGKRAARDESLEHPFGYGRERYFWAFVVALMLFSVGGLFALYEGIQRLLDPHEVENLTIAVVILVVAIGLESLALAKAVKEANKTRRDRSWWQFIRRSKSPEIPVVLLEDAGAELGLFLALGGVVVAQITGDPRWDAAGSLGIGVLLVAIAIVLAIEMKSLLIGEAAGARQLADIRSTIERAPFVERLIHLRTQHLGPEELLIGAKIELHAELSFAQVAKAINGVESLLRTEVPSARVIYLEPDVATETDTGVRAEGSSPGS